MAKADSRTHSMKAFYYLIMLVIFSIIINFLQGPSVSFDSVRGFHINFIQIIISTANIDFFFDAPGFIQTRNPTLHLTTKGNLKSQSNFFSKNKSLHTYVAMYSVSTESHMPRDGPFLIYDQYRYYHFLKKRVNLTGSYRQKQDNNNNNINIKALKNITKENINMGGQGSGRTPDSGSRASSAGRGMSKNIVKLGNQNRLSFGSQKVIITPEKPV